MPCSAIIKDALPPTANTETYPDNMQKMRNEMSLSNYSPQVSENNAEEETDNPLHIYYGS